jgi:hypothetical protein
MMAFTFKGFWQSRRNRIDLLITVLGIAWIFGHFVVALPASIVASQAQLKRFSYTFGFIVVMLRFFTVAGKDFRVKACLISVFISRQKVYAKNAYVDCVNVSLQILLFYFIVKERETSWNS